MIVDVDSSIENAWDSLLRFVMGLLKMGMRIEKESIERRKDNEAFTIENTDEAIEIEKQTKENLDVDINSDNINSNNKQDSDQDRLVVSDNESSNVVRTFYVAEADSYGWSPV